VRSTRYTYQEIQSNIKVTLKLNVFLALSVVLLSIGSYVLDNTMQKQQQEYEVFESGTTQIRSLLLLTLSDVNPKAQESEQRDVLSALEDASFTKYLGPEIIDQLNSWILGGLHSKETAKNLTINLKLKAENYREDYKKDVNQIKFFKRILNLINIFIPVGILSIIVLLLKRIGEKV
jgi:hypothetical protein